MTKYNFDEALLQCPLCYSRSFTLFEMTSNRGAILYNQICKQCGLVFLSPRMATEDIIFFYESQYRVDDIESGKPMQWVIEREGNRAHYQADLLMEWGQSPHRFLDIGASSGQLLRAVTEKFNCVSIGVEPGDVYRMEASQSFKLYSSIESLIDAQEPRFDTIVMSHVLEHLPKPIEFLSKLRECVLRADGVLFIEVPNLYGHSCFEPSHLYSFTKGTLSITLRAAGFSLIHVKTHSMPKDFGWRNISVLTRPSVAKKSIRRFILPAWVKFQREIGLSGTRHWYGYLYQQICKNLSGN